MEFVFLYLGTQQDRDPGAIRIIKIPVAMVSAGRRHMSVFAGINNYCHEIF